MLKKLFLLFCAILLLSCARNSSSVANEESVSVDPVDSSTAYASLWTGFGGNVSASNEVVVDLPNASFSVNSISGESGYLSYASPVIFTDSDGNQSVLVLWANDTELKLTKYSYSSNTLTKQTDFGTEGSVTFNINASNKMVYQLSLNIELSAPFVYVANAAGVSKVDALTGAVVATLAESTDVFRVLANGSNVYYQTADKAVLADTTLATIGSVNLGASTPIRQLPIIASASSIYFIQENAAVHKINSEFTSSTTESIDNANSESVANAAVYGDSIVYIVKKPKVVVFASQISQPKNYRWSTGLDVRVFGNSSFSTTYDKNNAGLGGVNNKWGDDKTDISDIDAIFSGDVSITALAVSVGNDQLYLPGFGTDQYASKVVSSNLYEYSWKYSPFDWSDYSDEKNGLTSGLVRVKTDDFASVYPSNQQLVGYSNPVSGFYFSYFYVSRFVLLNSDGSNVLSIANVSEDLHAANDIHGNPIQNVDGTYIDSSKVTNIAPKVSEDDDYSGSDWKLTTTPLFSDAAKSIPVDSTVLDNYNTQVILGNSTSVTQTAVGSPSLAIFSIAAGNKMVVLSGNDSNLYLID